MGEDSEMKGTWEFDIIRDGLHYVNTVGNGCVSILGGDFYRDENANWADRDDRLSGRTKYTVWVPSTGEELFAYPLSAALVLGEMKAAEIAPRISNEEIREKMLNRRECGFRGCETDGTLDSTWDEKTYAKVFYWENDKRWRVRGLVNRVDQSFETREEAIIFANKMVSDPVYMFALDLMDVIHSMAEGNIVRDRDYDAVINGNVKSLASFGELPSAWVDPEPLTPQERHGARIVKHQW